MLSTQKFLGRTAVQLLEQKDAIFLLCFVERRPSVFLHELVLNMSTLSKSQWMCVVQQLTKLKVKWFIKEKI